MGRSEVAETTILGSTRRRPGVPRGTALVLLALSTACGAPAVETDPLASIAPDVRADERIPPPLAEVWRRLPDDPVTLRPAVGDDSVHVVTGRRMLTWSTVDGSSRGAPILLESDISAPPVARGDEVIVATAGSDAAPPRLARFGADNVMIGLTPLQAPIRELDADGDVVVFVDADGVGRLGGGSDWHTSIEGPATVRLAVAARLALVTTGDGRLLALDIDNGEQRWELSTDAELSRARVAGGRVFLTAGSEGLLALDVRDGGIHWQRRTGTTVRGAPAVAQELVWIAGFDAKLRAYKASNGTEMGELTVALSSRNYLDLVSFEPWVVVGASYGPWIAVRGPTPFEIGQSASRRGQRARQVTVQQQNTPGRPDLSVPPASGPAGVAVTNWDGSVAFLQPRRSR